MTNEDDRIRRYEKMFFDFLSLKYVQRADARQKAMGLQYTTAETHDLARECAAFIINALPAASPITIPQGKERLREALDAAHFYIDAAPHELINAGMSRFDALYRARTLRDALPLKPVAVEVDPDLITAREIAASSYPGTATERAIIRGEFDEIKMVGSVVEGIKRGRELERGKPCKSVVDSYSTARRLVGEEGE